MPPSSLAYYTFLPLDNLCESIVDTWASYEDKIHAQKKKQSHSKQQFLAARSALRALLWQVTHSKEWQIKPHFKGKPFIYDLKNQPGPYISVSHTHRMVAAAISFTAPIGIDIEYFKERDFTALAKHSFGPQEQQSVEKKGIDEFYRIWTIREAIGKSTGEGLRFVTNQKDIALSVIDNTLYQSENYYLYTPTIDHCDYALAIALHQSNPSLLSGTIDYISI
jgi:phosphopantetheinyl transferase